LAAAEAELVETVRALIRIPSVNPVPADAPDGETRAARWIADALQDAGVPTDVLELVPGRGSVAARLRGDGSGGEPLPLLRPSAPSTSSRPHRTAGATARSTATSPTARSGAAARST